MRAIVLATCFTCITTVADAGCRIQTGKCVEVPEAAYTAPYKEGDRLPQGSFEVLLNVTYHGLAPSDGTFWYVRAGRHVYKVTPGTYVVLDDVTSEARRLSR